MVEVDYILRLNPVDPTRLETAEFDELWEDVEPFRPILAVMLLHGHVQVEDPDLLLGYFGNLPAYVLEFMLTYLRQTSRPYRLPLFSTPQRPFSIIHLSTRGKEMRRIWGNISSQRLQDYMGYWRNLLPKVVPLMEMFRVSKDYLRKFPESYHATCCNYDFIGVFMEAKKVHGMFVGQYLPLLEETRQWKSLPFYRVRTDLMSKVADEMQANTFRGPFPLDAELIHRSE